MYVPLVCVVLWRSPARRGVGGRGYCIVAHAAEDLYDVIPPHHQQPIRRAGERQGGVQTYTTRTIGGGGGVLNILKAPSPKYLYTAAFNFFS